MKVFVAVFFLCLAAVAHCEEWVPKTSNEIKEIRAECIKEHPLTEEQMIRMKNFDFPDEEPVRKYLLCSALKMDIFCTHEGYHPDRIAKQFKMDIDEAEVLAIAQSCVDKNEQKSPDDVWAFRGHKCLMSSKVGEKVKSFIKKKQEAEAKAAQ